MNNSGFKTFYLEQNDLDFEIPVFAIPGQIDLIGFIAIMITESRCTVFGSVYLLVKIMHFMQTNFFPNMYENSVCILVYYILHTINWQ